MSYQTIDAAAEIGRMPNGVAVLRVLQAHGINQLVRRDFTKGTLLECNTIEDMIDRALRQSISHEQRRSNFLSEAARFARGG